MNQIGKKIYYEKSTGNIVFITDERMGNVIETTIEQDFAMYKELMNYTTKALGVIQLDFGQYAEDFTQCNGYQVNLDTLELEFSYPDTENPTSPPVYQKPLTEQVSELESRTKATEDMILALLGGM